MEAIPFIQLQILGYIALAMLLGGFIGYDREMADKPAGLRTHMFVAGGAALLVSLGDVIVSHSGIRESVMNTDPIRVLQAIITGVSFLGAGTILQREDKGKIKGLTTAASLLFAAGVGASVALDQFVIAGGATVLSLITLRGLKELKERVDL